jgi:hypothetical protein
LCHLSASPCLASPAIAQRSSLPRRHLLTLAERRRRRLGHHKNPLVVFTVLPTVSWAKPRPMWWPDARFWVNSSVVTAARRLSPSCSAVQSPSVVRSRSDNRDLSGRQVNHRSTSAKQHLKYFVFASVVPCSSK